MYGSNQIKDCDEIISIMYMFNLKMHVMLLAYELKHEISLFWLCFVESHLMEVRKSTSLVTK